MRVVVGVGLGSSRCVGDVGIGSSIGRERFGRIEDGSVASTSAEVSIERLLDLSFGEEFPTSRKEGGVERGDDTGSTEA